MRPRFPIIVNHLRKVEALGQFPREVFFPLKGLTAFI
jgi:hypothetical protein